MLICQGVKYVSSVYMTLVFLRKENLCLFLQGHPGSISMRLVATPVQYTLQFLKGQ